MSKNNDQLRKKVIRLVGKVIRLNNGVFTIETPKHLRKVEQQKQERKQNKILSFGQRKALEQGQLMFGFDQYGKYWLPRKLMNAINKRIETIGTYQIDNINEMHKIYQINERNEINTITEINGKNGINNT